MARVYKDRVFSAVAEALEKYNLTPTKEFNSRNRLPEVYDEQGRLGHIEIEHTKQDKGLLLYADYGYRFSDGSYLLVRRFYTPRGRELRYAGSPV